MPWQGGAAPRGTAHHVQQFPDIPRPGMVAQHLQSVGMQPRCLIPPIRRPSQEAVSQVVQIFLPLAQRRQVDGLARQPIVEILSKGALLHKRRQLTPGGRQHTDVHLDRLAAADARDDAVFQHAQEFRLELERHLADFVEENRAALGMLEMSFAHLVGAGERTPLMTEEFAGQ